MLTICESPCITRVTNHFFCSKLFSIKSAMVFGFLSTWMIFYRYTVTPRFFWIFSPFLCKNHIGIIQYKLHYLLFYNMICYTTKYLILYSYKRKKNYLRKKKKRPFICRENNTIKKSLVTSFIFKLKTTALSH